MGQACHKKICSFQLMESNPSISWQYFHKLEAIHLLATNDMATKQPISAAADVFINAIVHTKVTIFVYLVSTFIIW